MTSDGFRYVIGIDPGLNGGIAVLGMSGVLVDVVKMPSTPYDIYEYLKGYGVGAVCYMELVGQGMPNQSSKATATFARHCGHLDMALLSLGIPTRTVTPSKWEKSYGLGSSKGVGKTEWKNRLKSRAQQLFPWVGVTLATSDALLIAEYGRRQEKGQ